MTIALLHDVDHDDTPKWRRPRYERLTPEIARQLTVRMFDCYKPEQLRAIGVEIRNRFAQDELQRRDNAELLNRLRKAYAGAMAGLERGRR
jgi:hypothetical protein